LVADIKGFFDTINHEWLLKNQRLHKDPRYLVEGWVKAGAVDKNIIISSEKWTVQGGIISPTLANITLNGLERLAWDSIKHRVKNKEQSKSFKGPDRSQKFLD